MTKWNVISDPSVVGPNMKFGMGIDGVAAYYDELPFADQPRSNWYVSQWHTSETLRPNVMKLNDPAKHDSNWGNSLYSWSTKKGNISLAVYERDQMFGYRLSSYDGDMYSDGSQNIFLETKVTQASSLDKNLHFYADERISKAQVGGIAQQVLNGFVVVFNSPTSLNYDSKLQTKSAFLQYEVSDSRGTPPKVSSYTSGMNLYNISGAPYLPFLPSDQTYNVDIDLRAVTSDFIKDYMSVVGTSSPSGFSDLSRWSVDSVYIGLETLDGGGATIDISNVKLQADDDPIVDKNSKPVKLTNITPGSSAAKGVVDGNVSTIMAANGNTVITNYMGANVIVVDAANIMSNGPDKIQGGTGLTRVTTMSSGATITGGDGAMIVTASSGSNTIFAGAGGLTYSGGSGADTVIGLGKPMSVVAGVGGGTFIGGGNASIKAGLGGDTNIVIGGNGDKLYSAGGKDVLFGATGGDVLMSSEASSGTNVFFGAGGNGKMTFITGSGTNLLALGQNQNDVTLGSGHAVIYGNGGSTSDSHIRLGTGSLDMAFSGAKTVLDIVKSASRSVNLYELSKGSNHLHLIGYSDFEVDQAIKSQTNIAGSAQLTLPDNTVITTIGTERILKSLFI